MNDAITPFTLAVPQADLEGLNRRIDQTRWPDAETVDDWTQGAPLANVKALVDHWRHRYDWRRCEAMLNGWGQYKTAIDGLDIHFLHVRSKHENALPLIITHGWPGSVIEFMKIIGPLTDPTAHGGRAEDAFHVIVPSLPGHGFSDKATETGWGIPRIAGAWITLMRRLGYTRWVAQGGDGGSVVTTIIGATKPDDCAAIHVNMPLVFPEPDQFQNLDPFEQAAVASLAHWDEKGSGYFKQQSTRPQTLGYGLAGRPGGLDLREDVGLERQSGKPRGRPDPGRDAGSHHALLAAGDRDVLRPAILGKLHHRHCGGQAGDSRRRQRLSARDPPPLSALGRSVDAKPDPLQHPGSGRPLRRLATAGAARQGNPRLLRQGALTSAN
jgi:pimeloyl-ACP methyl ester carboxylesterase